MKFSIFCLFAFAAAFSPEVYPILNNPDAIVTTMKTVVIPMMRNEYAALNHAEMHQDMKEDNIQMKFVDRLFDFCVGEDEQKMTFEEDRKCSEKIFEMVIDHVPEEVETEAFLENEDQELINQLNSLVDVNEDGHFSRSESKEVFYCYLRMAFQKGLDFGIIQDNIASHISDLATKITEIMKSDEAQSYFEGHRRLYQAIEKRFNEVRLQNLFADVEPTSRGLTKLVVKLFDEFSDFAAEVYADY